MFLSNLIYSSIQKEVDDRDHYTNAYAVFYKDLQAYRELLEERDTIDWGQIFQLQGIN